MVGRKPKPTRIKQLAGNPGNHRLNLHEPAAIGASECPSHLDRIARREWQRVAPLLKTMGVLGGVDQSALAAYCASYSMWVAAKRALRKAGGMTSVSPAGAEMTNPHVRIVNNALDQMRKFMVEFGMTPSSRSRLSGNADTAKKDNPFADLASEARAVQ